MMVYRTSIKDILVEIAFPEHVAAQGVIVLCDGLPAVPSQKRFMTVLASKGYVVAYPRYRGTWESGGTFLAHSPVHDIRDVVDTFYCAAPMCELYEQKKLHLPQGQNIAVVGVSFGGSVALALASDTRVSRVVALAPIVDFAEFAKPQYRNQDLYFLGQFLRRGFPYVYRFHDDRWKDLCQGNIFTPLDHVTSEDAKKIMVLFGDADTVVNAQHALPFLEKKGIPSSLLPGLAHPSFGTMENSSFLEKTLQWIEKE